MDAFYICPFLPDAPVAEFRHPDHPDRKPNPGMILRAIAEVADRSRPSPDGGRQAFRLGGGASDARDRRRAVPLGVIWPPSSRRARPPATMTRRVRKQSDTGFVLATIPLRRDPESASP